MAIHETNSTRQCTKTKFKSKNNQTTAGLSQRPYQWYNQNQLQSALSMRKTVP